MERAQELHLSGCEALRYGQGDAVLASVLEHGRLTLLDISAEMSVSATDQSSEGC